MAGQEGFVQPAASPNMLAQLAQQLGGTAAIPAVQRSQYLADALQSISHAGEGIKSYGALGANLLADVLLRYGQSKSNADLLKSVQGAQGNIQKFNLTGSGFPGDPLLDQAGAGSGPVSGAPPSVASSSGSSSGPVDSGVSPPAGPAAPVIAPTSAPGSTGPSPKAQALAALIKGGLSPVAAAGLVGGFTQESGPNLSRNNPAEGAIGMANWEGPRGQAAQQFFAQNGGPTIDNQAKFALNELHGPESRAMAALQAAQDPQSAAAAALQFERPAGWTPHGAPQNASGWAGRLAGAQELLPMATGLVAPQQAPVTPPMGGQLIQASNPQLGGTPTVPPPQLGGTPVPPPPQLGGTPLPPPGPPSAPDPGAPPLPPPLTMPQGGQLIQASNPGPSMAQGAPLPQGGLPQQGAMDVPPAPNIQAPQMAGGGQGTPPQMAAPPPIMHSQPTGAGPTAQEIAQVQMASQAPIGSALWQQGQEVIARVRARHSQPIAAPEKMMWDQASGQYVPLPGLMTQQLPGASPSDQAQRDAFGNITHASIPGVQGTLPEGTALVNGQIVRIQGGGPHPMTQAERQAWNIPADDHNSYAIGPDGKPFVAAQSTFTPENAANMRHELVSNAQFNESREASKAYQSMVELSKLPPGGMRAYALRDTFARVINPKGAVRLGTIQAIADTQGLPDNIKGWLMNLKGDGPVDPRIAQQILDAALPFARENYQIASSMNEGNAGFAQRHGGDPRDVTVDIGGAPSPFNIAQWEAAQAANGHPGNPTLGGNPQSGGPMPGAPMGGGGGQKTVAGVPLPSDAAARAALRQQVLAEIARRNGHR